MLCFFFFFPSDLASATQEDMSGKSFKGYIQVTLSLSRPIRVTSEEAFFHPNISPENTGMDEPASPLSAAVAVSLSWLSFNGGRLALPT